MDNNRSRKKKSWKKPTLVVLDFKKTYNGGVADTYESVKYTYPS